MTPVARFVTLTASVAVLAFSLAAAYPAKEDDSYYYSRLHDLSNFNKDVRNLDGVGGASLLRDLDLLRNRALFSRGSRDQEDLKKQQMGYHFMDPLMGNTIGTAKRSGCCDSISGRGIGTQKRPFDEIDRSSFNSFVKKNFDEIDRSGFGSFIKKNFDEIDRSGFGSFVKRSAPQAAPETAHN